MSKLENRYEFMLLFDVQDGNPNGDPDLGNQPRMDLETSYGLVTDVCLKRKVRNYVMLTQNDKPGYDIFVKEKAVLNTMIAAEWDKAADEWEKKANGRKTDEVKKTKKAQEIEDWARKLLCEKYFDIRTFGAVLSTGDKGAGQVRGPIQLTFSRSFDPIVVAEHSDGQMLLEVDRTIRGGCPIAFVGNINGTMIRPEEIMKALEEE